MPPIIDRKICTSCGICHKICPQDVFTMENATPPAVTYPDECWYCGGCVVDCPEKAIALDLPLYLHIVPSPALYGPDAEADELAKAAAFSRSVTRADENGGKR